MKIEKIEKTCVVFDSILMSLARQHENRVQTQHENGHSSSQQDFIVHNALIEEFAVEVLRNTKYRELQRVRTYNVLTAKSIASHDEIQSSLTLRGKPWVLERTGVGVTCARHHLSNP
jgi:hypothetical protein